MLSWLLYSKTLNVSEQWQNPLNPAAILLFSEDISESSLLLNLHLLFAAALTTSGDTVVFFSGRGVMKKNNNFCCKVSGLCTFQGRWSGTSVPHFTSIASCGQVPNIDELSKRKKKHSIVSIYTVQLLSVEQKTFVTVSFCRFCIVNLHYVFCVGCPFCYSNKDKMGKTAHCVL